MLNVRLVWWTDKNSHYSKLMCICMRNEFFLSLNLICSENNINYITTRRMLPTLFAVIRYLLFKCFKIIFVYIPYIIIYLFVILLFYLAFFRSVSTLNSNGNNNNDDVTTTDFIDCVVSTRGREKNPYMYAWRLWHCFELSTRWKNVVYLISVHKRRFNASSGFISVPIRKTYAMNHQI